MTMTLEMLTTWIIVGLVTGWLVGSLMKAGGHGRVWDLLLALAGSGAASTIAATLVPDAGGARLATIVAAFGGAALLMIVQRKIWPAFV
jgi:uncharacterized membrane protein YeaQ/YmgE (transglycosylase-associated protein family)